MQESLCSITLTGECCYACSREGLAVQRLAVWKWGSQTCSHARDCSCALSSAARWAKMATSCSFRELDVDIRLKVPRRLQACRKRRKKPRSPLTACLSEKPEFAVRCQNTSRKSYQWSMSCSHGVFQLLASGRARLARAVRSAVRSCAVCPGE